MSINSIESIFSQETLLFPFQLPPTIHYVSSSPPLAPPLPPPPEMTNILRELISFPRVSNNKERRKLQFLRIMDSSFQSVDKSPEIHSFPPLVIPDHYQLMERMPNGMQFSGHLDFHFTRHGNVNEQAVAVNGLLVGGFPGPTRTPL